MADDRGIACPAGAFWIDPWRPVPVAVVTHAHSDHARPGMGRYYCAAAGEGVLRRRVGANARIIGVPWGQPVPLGEAEVSFHPAGHCLGAAQIRVSARVAGRERVAVAAGDYKRAPDPTCDAFELVPCDTFITEATFALPIYAWRDASVVAGEMLAWWRANARAGRVSVVCAYALGKAQRVLGELAMAVQREATPPPGDVVMHGAMASMMDPYHDARVRGADGVERPVRLLTPRRIEPGERAKGRANPFRGALVLAPPGAAGSSWMRRLGPERDVETAFASGWMAVRGVRRRRGYDRGFVMSDHADWAGLLRTCAQTGARRVLCTHGQSATLARYLNERGIPAEELHTEFGGEDGAAAGDPPGDITHPDAPDRAHDASPGQVNRVDTEQNGGNGGRDGGRDA